MNTRPPPPPLLKATAPAKKPEALPTTKHQQPMPKQQPSNQQRQQPKQKALPAPNVRHSTKRAVTEQEATERLRREATTYPAPRDVDPTEDYWIREGNLWKRAHIVPRATLYVPQQTMDGPDITKVVPERTTFVHPTSGIRPFRIDDDGTTKQSATLNIEWTGSTNFEETTAYKDEYIEDDGSTNVQHGMQLASKHQHSQQHKSELNMSSHTYLTAPGVQHVSKTKDAQTTILGNKANCQSYSLTSVFSKHMEKHQQHQS